MVFGFLLILLLNLNFALGAEYRDDQQHLDSEEHSNSWTQEASWRAVEEYNKASNDAFHWIPVEVLEARNELVIIGSRVTTKILIARSNCTKFAHEKPDKERCKPKDVNDWKACIFSISQLYWKIPEEISLLECSDYNPTNKSQSIKPITSAPLQTKSPETITVPLQLLDPEESSSTLWDKFLGFIEKFGRMYFSAEERMKRFKIFKQNMRFAEKLQFDEKGTAVYGETQFSDLTPEEFKKVMLPSIWPTAEWSGDDDFDLEKYNLTLDNLPEFIDWRDEGAVTPVKNQGSCGSCWAFSVTGNIEGLWAIKTGDLVSLSEQELVDCDIVDKGCNGGLPINAFHEIIRMGGLEPEKLYPYKAKSGICHLVRSEIAVYINDSVKMPRNETILQAWIAQKGPLSVGIDAELLSLYKHGILHPLPKRCPPMQINHGVLIVGYGIENHMPYWIIKNSWGSEWGESGYFRLMRGKDVCGVSEMASSAIIY